MKKVLFICSPFYGYENIIKNYMKELLGYEVYYLDVKKHKGSYKNFFEKIYDEIIYKTINKTSLKRKREFENLKKEIEKIGEFDTIFCIRPDSLREEFLKYLVGLKKEMFVHFWDSFTHIPKQKKMLEYFEHTSTFDMKEAKAYNMKFVPNFYVTKNLLEKSNKIEYDIFTVMVYDKRFELLEKIAKGLKEKGVKYLFVVCLSEKNPNYNKIKNNKYIRVQSTKLSLKEATEYLSKSKAILEIGHKNKGTYQGGLSFRAIDALGNKKKLITTYDFIKDYDFYCEENIKIISEENCEIEKEFFEIEYKELPKEIYESYSDRNWVKKIFF